MGGLEHLLKGIAVGAASTLDPVGTMINHLDSWMTGASIADKERAIPTLYARIAQSAYPDYKAPVSFPGYAARAVGGLIGTVAGIAGLFGIGRLLAPYMPHAATASITKAATIATVSTGVAATSPVIAGALAIPAVLGAYGIIRATGKYLHNMFAGETIDGRPGQKGSFYDGFRWGWHGSTHLDTMLGIHNWEQSLTGRGPYDSHVRSSITTSARRMRRNVASIAGSVAGAGVAGASYLGLYAAGALLAGPIGGILAMLSLPAYKSIRDIGRSVRSVRPMPAH